MIKKYNQYIKESLLNKLKGPSDDDVIKYYLDNRKYTELLYFGLRRLKYDIIKLALENKANTKDLLEEIYDNDFSDDSFKKLFDIIDINIFDSNDITKFLFKIYIEQREILIPKLDFNDNQIMYSILKELSYKSAYRTVDILFKNKLPDNLIIYLLNKLYDNNNFELFKYIIENYEIPYHYDDDLLLYHIVSYNKWYKSDVLKLILNKDVNIYARNNDIINHVIKEKEFNINTYNLFKEKDKKNLMI